MFSQVYFHYNDVKRPLEKCKNNTDTLKCIGMPSGHAEISTIIFTLLYVYKFISLEICIVFIFLFSIQRIISNMHTPGQVILGIIFGLCYSYIYSFSNFFLSFFIVFIIGIVLNILIVKKIDENLNQPIPKWVDRNMYSIIKKKKDVHYHVKLLSVYMNAFKQEILYISWNKLEFYLDKIVEKIKNTGIEYDAVVGIKSGGAIISDYISKKLNIKNYKIKLSKSDYKCNKTSSDSVIDVINRLLNNFGNYDICEEIDENLMNKKVILIDEQLYSGTTMYNSIKYLKETKKVEYVYPITISKVENPTLKSVINSDYITSQFICVWPWGYDN